MKNLLDNLCFQFGPDEGGGGTAVLDPPVSTDAGPVADAGGGLESARLKSDTIPLESKPAGPGLATAAKKEEEETPGGEEPPEEPTEIKLDDLRLKLQQLDKAKEAQGQPAAAPAQQQPVAASPTTHKDPSPRAIEVYRETLNHPSFDRDYLNALLDNKDQDFRADAILYAASMAIAANESKLIENAKSQSLEAFTQNSETDRVLTNALQLLYTTHPEISSRAESDPFVIHAIDFHSNRAAKELGFEGAEEYVLAAHREGEIGKLKSYVDYVGRQVKKALNMVAAQEASQATSPGAIPPAAKAQAGRKPGQQMPGRVSKPPAAGERRAQRTGPNGSHPTSEEEKNRLKFGTFDEF